MMKRTLSLLLCLIMVLGLAVPSVQAAETDEYRSIDNIMDNVIVEDGSVVIDGNVVNSSGGIKLPYPADLLPKSAEVPYVMGAPVAETPVQEEICKCADLSSAVAHGGICQIKAPYIEMCENLSAEELFDQWDNYTLVEQTFLQSCLKEQFPLKNFEFEKFMNAPTGSATETYADGTTVSVQGIPQDGSVTVGEAADQVKDIVDAYVAENSLDVAAPLFSYDVSVQDGQGTDWQPETSVKMELELPGEKLHKNALVYVVHVDDEGNASTIEAEVTEDGKIAFETPGFSVFYGFTVDFEFEGAQFSINGMSSIKLSELFQKLHMPLDAENVADVQFSNSEYIRVEKLDGDWELFSLKAFNTTEMLTLTMNDGEIYEITVTDAQYAKVYVGGSTSTNYDADSSGTCNGIITWAATNNGDLTNSVNKKGWSRTKQVEIRGPGTMIIKLEGNNSSHTNSVLYVDLLQLKITGGAEVEIRVNDASGVFHDTVNMVGITSSACDTDNNSASKNWALIWVADGKLKLTGQSNRPLLIGGDYHLGHGSRDTRSDHYSQWPLVLAGSSATSITANYTQFIHSASGAIGSQTGSVPSSLSLALDHCTFHKSIYNNTGIKGGAVNHWQTGTGGTVSITNCTFNGTENMNESGGAVCSNGGFTSFTIQNSTFSGCKSSGYGGGVLLVGGGGTVSVSGSTFQDIMAHRTGGALSIVDGQYQSISVTTTTFNNCDSTGYGGAIAVKKSTDGGATPIGVTGNISIIGCSFQNCLGGNLTSAGKENGVQITWDHDNNPSTPNIDKLNGASGAGAIIIGGTVGGKVEIKGASASSPTLFENCLTWNNGGAIYFTNDLNITGVTDSETKEFEALTLQFLNINKCFARDAGNAIYFSSSVVPQFDFKNSTIQYCGYFDQNDPNFPASLVEINSEWFSATSAEITKWLKYKKEDFYPGTDYSGTLRTVGNTAVAAHISDCEFKYNRSFSHGGAIYWNANRIVYSDPDTKNNPLVTASLTITNTPMHHNTAGRFGGALFCEGNATIESCNIYNNTAAECGGGIAQNIYNNSSRQLGESGANEKSMITLRAVDGGQPVKIYNNTAQDGGGISITVGSTNSYPHTVKDGTADADKDKPVNWIFKTDFTYEVSFQLGGTHVYGNNAYGHGGGIYYNVAYYQEGREGTTDGDGIAWTERQRQIDSYIKKVTIDSGLIYSNTAGYTATASNGGGNGGGVYVNSSQYNTADTIPSGQKTGSSTITISGGSIYKNTATMGNGGGVYLQGTNAVCKIEGENTAIGAQYLGQVDGKANLSTDGRNTATGKRLGANNYSGGNGGGIAIFGKSRIEMSGGYVINNKATTAGGGIAVHDNSTMYLSNGYVDGNEASMGGGISINNAKGNANASDEKYKYGMLFAGGYVQNNSAVPNEDNVAYGGGICLSNSATMKLGTASSTTDSSITGNKAVGTDGTTFASGQEGGGIAVCMSSTMEIADGNITNNQAYSGGGMVIRGSSSVTMTGSLVLYTKAEEEADAAKAEDQRLGIKEGDVNLEKSKGIIAGNQAWTYGGGVYMNSAANTLTMTGGCINANKAIQGTSVNSACAGGGIYINTGSSFTLNGGHVDDNSASDAGGIHINKSTVTINQGAMLRNKAIRNGGAMYCDYGTVNVTGGDFKYNLTDGSGQFNPGHGGAIFGYGTTGSGASNIVITGGNFENNYAKNAGGAISAEGTKGSFTIANATFKNNSTQGSGGAIYCNAPSLTINSGKFENNVATVNGGAFYADHTSASIPCTTTISGGTFTGNIAKAEGGGAYFTNVKVDFQTGTFEGNASMYGGGMMIKSCPDVDFTGGIIDNNHANQGGGIFIRDSVVDISNIEVKNNAARTPDNDANNQPLFTNVDVKHGGGILVDSLYTTSTVTINTGTFSDNSAPYGGGMWIKNGSSIAANLTTVEINGGEFVGNTASVDGAGIYINGNDLISNGTQTSLTLNGGTIGGFKADGSEGGNIAQGNGGGIWAGNLALVKILATESSFGEVSRNTAKNGGGVYVTAGADLDVENGYIINNNAVAPTMPTMTTAKGNDAILSGVGGGVCVTAGKDGAITSFTLSGEDMAIYGNKATFAADDVFSSGTKTVLTLPEVAVMDLAGYGINPEGWIEDYCTDDSAYGQGINMIDVYASASDLTTEAAAAIRATPKLRYRNASAAERRYMLVKPVYVLGPSEPTDAVYANKNNAYVCLTLGIPAAIDDNIVVDYRLTVNIDLLENDLFMNDDEFTDTGKLGVQRPAISDANKVYFKDQTYFSKGDNPVGTFQNNLYRNHGHLTYGNAYRGDTGYVTYGFSDSVTKLEYAKEETFCYTLLHNQYWYYGKVTIVPATMIYYEDNTSGAITYHTTSTLENLAEWTQVKNGAGIDTQDEDRPGKAVLGGIDADNVYGFDSTYESSTAFSGGKAHMVTVNRHTAVDNGNGQCGVCGLEIPGTHQYKNNGFNKCEICLNTEDKHSDEIGEHECTDGNNYNEYCDICSKWIGTHANSARATFTFTGTGFDIMSLCNQSTGMVMVSVFKGVVADWDDPWTNEYVASYFVDTYYEHDSSNLYQVPVIKADLRNVMIVEDDPYTKDVDETQYKDWGYGTYSVEIYASSSFFPWEQGYWSTDFYLDGIRIYNPAGIGENISDTVLNAYKEDAEAWPAYAEIRNMILSTYDLEALKEMTEEEAAKIKLDGCIFIDGKGDTQSVKDYTSWGPNNEVYLNPGESIAFTMDMTGYGQDVAGIHLGVRGLTGMSSVLVQAGTGANTKTTLLDTDLSTTDMYYNIGKKDADGNFIAAGKVVTITNDGDKPIAISNVKVTHGTMPTNNARLGGLFSSSLMTGYTALEILNAEQLADPVVTPKYPALSFDGMVCYNVFLTAEDLGHLTSADLGLAVFSTEDTEGTVDTAREVIYGATEVDGLYMVSTSGVHAKYLSDRQYFRAFAKKADGSYVYSKMVSYSALEYATNVLSQPNDVALKQLMVAMLNYGAEAQKFFGYKTEDLMNKYLTADQLALVEGFNADSLNPVGKVDASKVGAFASTGGFTKRYPAISFKGAFEINYFMAPANAVDGDMTLYFWNEDTYNSVTELTVENADKAVAMTLEDGLYSASSDQIIAKNLDKTLYVAAVYESDGVTYCSGVLPYSIASYCQKPPADVAALANAAAIYGCTAKEYFGA